MNMYDRLHAITQAERSDHPIEAAHSWLSISNLLNQPRYEKYAVWITTGKIAPESGQISPDLAHYGQRVTMY